MTTQKRRRRKRVSTADLKVSRFPKFALAALIAVGLWLGWRGFVFWQATQQLPSAIVVLGGGTLREKEAAALSVAYSDIPVYISSGSQIPCLYRTFVQERGVSWDRVIPDLRASDTVTNFTALVPYLANRAPRKVLMMATAGQTDRAMLIGSLVWGSRGIAIEPVRIPGEGHNESDWKMFRDGLRAFAWTVLGDLTVEGQYKPEIQVRYLQKVRESDCENEQRASLPADVDLARTFEQKVPR